MFKPRALSQSISFGTSSAAVAIPGLEKMPTVLMACIEQVFLVPFRAQDRAFDNVGPVAHLSHGRFHSLASRPPQLGVAHDAAFPYVMPPHLKLRLDEYNHFAARL